MSANLQDLSSDALEHRLADLLARDRDIVVDFLLHLEELMRRELYLERGFSSAWDYCKTRLGLMDGAAYRRISCARLLGRFPQAAAMLREGRLSLTTLSLLKDVLTQENADKLFS